MSTEKGQVLRTKSKAEGALQNLPKDLALITNRNYQYGLTTYCDGLAYICRLPEDEQFKFRNAVLYYRGFPVTGVQLERWSKSQQEGKEDKIDLPLLRLLYSIVLSQWQGARDKENWKGGMLTIYVPELMRCMGKGVHTGKNDFENLKSKLDSLSYTVGVLKAPDTSEEKVLQVLQVVYDERNNTIQVRLPYVVQLILNVHKASVLTDKTGQPRLRKDGSAVLAASHSYLVRSSIAKERNKPAVEVVCIVVALIERTGGPRKGKDVATPHIKVSTIIDRCPLLRHRMEKAASSSAKDKVLKQVFSRAWELLPTQTRLTEIYRDIRLPQVNEIPTIQTLETAITFSHGGKR